MTVYHVILRQAQDDHFVLSFLYVRGEAVYDPETSLNWLLNNPSSPWVAIPFDTKL
jgi:hypothetical protein